MKGLLATGATRAWLVVALVGLVVLVLVLGLRLGPRLGAGQDLIDAAKPALTGERVAGDRAGIDFISRYVDLVDPLATARGGASGEVETLIDLVAKRTKRSRREVAAVLRREAPHTEALLRTLPLSGVAQEIPAFTRYLATTLNVSEETIAAQVEQSFPALSQTLTALPSVTSGWNDVPGLRGLTRIDGGAPVTSVPQLRTYFSKDLVGTVERDREDFQDLAGSGGLGYIPTLLLVLGVVLLAYGVLKTRRARRLAPGPRSWGVVAAIGLLLLALVDVRHYSPRLEGADRLVTSLDPVFAPARVQGDRAGTDMIHQTVLFGDPIAMKRGGAAAEAPELVAFVARRTGTKRAEVRAALRRRTPRTSALLDAIPLSSVASEVPHLLTFLGKTLKLSRAELLTTLQDRTPHLAQSILAVRPVATRWNAIPGSEQLTRFDGVTPVRTMHALDDYFSGDVIPVIENQRANFRDLADPWPSLTVFAPLLRAVGALLFVYGLAMIVLQRTQRRKRSQ